MGLWCSLNWKFCADSGTALLFFARPKLRPRSGLFRRARPGRITTRSGLGLRLTKKFTSQDLKISSGLLHKIFFLGLSGQVPASAVCSKVAAFAPSSLPLLLSPSLVSQLLLFSLPPAARLVASCSLPSLPPFFCCQLSPNFWPVHIQEKVAQPL